MIYNSLPLSSVFIALSIVKVWWLVCALFFKVFLIDRLLSSSHRIIDILYTIGKISTRSFDWCIVCGCCGKSSWSTRRSKSSGFLGLRKVPVCPPSKRDFGLGPFSFCQLWRPVGVSALPSWLLYPPSARELWQNAYLCRSYALVLFSFEAVTASDCHSTVLPGSTTHDHMVPSCSTRYHDL